MSHAMTITLCIIISLLVPVSVTAGIATENHENEFTASAWPGGLIIDHTCIDLDSIPADWIDASQDNIRIHYAHTSHGGQITTGLTRLEADNSTYSQVQGSGTLPVEAGALCILDGNPPHAYITPDLYWETIESVGITQNTLDSNPTITVSLWSWCTQLNSYSDTQTQTYLNTMSALETANPGVTFVYMTCNAQTSGGDGYNRWTMNEMIRQYCIDNDKVLFDFADLDCWSNGVQNTYNYEHESVTYQVPLEHEDFDGNEAGHTTYTSCEQKGRAFWWLVASLAGWNSDPSSTTTTPPPNGGTTPTPTDGTPLDSNVFLVAGVAVVALVGASIVMKRRK